MCGIVGIAACEPVKERGWLRASREALAHRGPDDAGEWWAADGRVGLGHRRLAILDLTPAGHQPMLDETETLCLVFNGEIYNFLDLRKELEGKGYAFRSRTDTEVVLAAYRAWGPRCVERFNGIFAFALYDSESQRLFLARDRAGEKPLFYTHSNGEFRFASELKALFADLSFPRVLDLESLGCYLAFGFVPGERCLLRGVRKLPPAYSLLYELKTDEIYLQRYWDLPPLPEVNHVEVEALVNELEWLLEDAVRQQLVADVPVGILLSGGVDSSIVTALAARACPRVKTFTVRFPGYHRHDETEHARLVADHFGTDHLELDATEVSPDLLVALARQYDEPIVDSSMVPTSLVCELVRRQCTVALGGDGGDELFGGYNHYNRLLRIKQAVGWLPLAVRAWAAHMAGVMLPAGFRGRNYLQAAGQDLRRQVPLVASYFDRHARMRLLPSRLYEATCQAERIWEHNVWPTGDLLERATRTDFRLYLAEDILVKVDRASMLHSLEIRAPFLDYRVIEFAFGKVPSCLKATSAARKILTKRLAARLLPREFDLERKQGFSIPLDTWLQNGAWRQTFEEVLLSNQDGIFDHRFVNSLLDGQTKGRSNGERLFALVLFELWRREYKVSFS